MLWSGGGQHPPIAVNDAEKDVWPPGWLTQDASHQETVSGGPQGSRRARVSCNFHMLYEIDEGFISTLRQVDAFVSVAEEFYERSGISFDYEALSASYIKVAVYAIVERILFDGLGSPHLLLLSGIGPSGNGISFLSPMLLQQSLIQVEGITDSGAYLEASSNVLPYPSPEGFISTLRQVDAFVSVAEEFYERSGISFDYEALSVDCGLCFNRSCYPR
ncbi:Glucose-methanol-choline oxidoreductase, C-terminal [Artemisia annua]|uniref:Glucose-methanol-choline oxidoreductase, C-terminal n=1 Tax=Artemisia annua TaxID=35608 RepID=A0A2U1P508_ARTAN|nr:Glucose-methanol-choline oxidoreductase, C-terminal [Artemisia annua]